MGYDGSPEATGRRNDHGLCVKRGMASVNFARLLDLSESCECPKLIGQGGHRHEAG
jgi:hypothetical protein